MDFFEKTLSEAKTALQKSKTEYLDKKWTIRKGETILVQATKGEIIRRMCYDHIIHHRAQLGIYLRLLNIPIPATTGRVPTNRDSDSALMR